MTPEREKQMRERMKQFGLSDEQIEERIKQMKSGNFQPGQRPGGAPPGQRQRGEGPPPVVER